MAPPHTSLVDLSLMLYNVGKVQSAKVQSACVHAWDLQSAIARLTRCEYLPPKCARLGSAVSHCSFDSLRVFAS